MISSLAHRSIVCALVAASPLALAQPGPDETGGGWKATRLDLTVTVEPSSKRLTLAGTLHVRLDLDSSLGPTLAVNYNDDLMRFVEVTGPSGSKVTLGQEVPDRKAMRTAAVRLAQAAKRGAEIDVSFVCETTGNQGYQFKLGPDIALSSWTSAWYPCAIPAPGVAPSQDLIRIPGTTRFVLPTGWRAVSNGTLVEHRDESARAVDVFAVDAPVARSFSAARYVASTQPAGERTVGIYVLGPKKLGVEPHARLLAKALAAQEARFGPYPYASYAIAEVPEGLVEWYASSEQGFIMATSSAFDVEHGNLPLWAHEMAHGWWGNLVSTTGPGTKWISESLAQYSAVVAIETVEGASAAAEFLDYSRSGYSAVQCAHGYFGMSRRGEDTPIAPMTGAHPFEHNLSDAKGHWIYHMLRQRVGDDVFFGTLREIIRDFSRAPLTVTAVRERFEKAAPDAGLDAFFAQWLDRAGAPVIDLDWWSDDSGTKATITLTQRQDEPFVLPLEVAIDLRDGKSKVATLDLAKREQTFEVETGARPIAVRLDPSRRSLVWRPEYGPRPAAGNR